MSKLVVIKLGRGNLNDGFSTVTVQLWETDSSRPVQFIGSLPTAPEIAELYKRLQLIYQALYQPLRKRSLLEIEPVGLNNVSESDFSDVCKQLHDQINTWLNSNSFRKIDQQLRARLALDEEIRVIIETSDNLLRRLPWHLWNFFEDYQKAEVALSSPEFEQVKRLPKTTTDVVRILAILGNTEGIEVQQDRAIIEQLPDAETVFLIEPLRHELDRWLRDEQGWDILFFAGHSQTQGSAGQIHINQTNSLTIPQLKNALRYAIKRGLTLTIFNSCDGLGLAQELADLHIPQIIVMREVVPDVVAQEFLKNFLTAFAGGQSFYLAVRGARESLQGLENDFPGASWLPVICQNPAEEPPTWQKLSGQERKQQPLPIRRSLKTLLLLSVAITSLLIGVRSSGILQGMELRAFDRSMRLRPNEKPDDRLLIVAITEADIQAQKQRQRSSLSDEVLAQLLRRLKAYQPRAIGLDIYRDFPVEPGYEDLVTHLRDNERFIAICKVSGGKGQAIGISPPPDIPAERLGFSDVVRDPDLVLRRHLLALTPDPKSPCKIRYALSLQLVRLYLKQEGIELDITREGYLQLGSIVFKPMETRTGGYQQLDARGHQVLLNYRSSPKIAQQVTLTKVLTGQLDPDLVRNRIVLIGVDSESIRDHFFTPYSVGQYPLQEVSGVIVQAHMASQILSAVLDNRPLLWVWSQWGEALWIWGWSLVGGAGGILIQQGTSKHRIHSQSGQKNTILRIFVAAWSRFWLLRLGLVGGVALGTLNGFCFVLLLKGGWVPLVPATFALVLTAGSMVVCTPFQTRR